MLTAPLEPGLTSFKTLEQDLLFELFFLLLLFDPLFDLDLDPLFDLDANANALV